MMVCRSNDHEACRISTTNGKKAMDLKKTCDGCGKTPEQVIGFFATPSAALCGECVMRAAYALLNDRPEAPTVGENKLRAGECSFCGRLAEHVTRMVVFPKMFICNECVFMMIDGLLKEKKDRSKFIQPSPSV